MTLGTAGYADAEVVEWRFYARTSRRTGVSMPFWLVPFAALLWLTLAVVYWFGLLIVGAGILAFRLGERGVRSWRSSHPH